MKIRTRIGTRARHVSLPSAQRVGAVISSLTGAFLRAALVVVLIATPSALVPVRSDPTPVVAVLALLAALFTAVEYHARAPSLLEFRDAPPYNRIRFATLFAVVFLLAVMSRATSDPTTLTRAVVLGARGAAHLLDFPYSPVRLLTLVPGAGIDAVVVVSFRQSAALAALVGLCGLAFFVCLLRLGRWPSRHESLNLWVNLPTFDPTTGNDVILRLRRDACVNLILGALLPFLIPASLKLVSDLLVPLDFANPQTLLWTTAAWAFLPVSIVMRGMALGRVARMLAEQRRRVYEEHADGPAEAMLAA